MGQKDISLEAGMHPYFDKLVYGLRETGTVHRAQSRNLSEIVFVIMEFTSWQKQSLAMRGLDYIHARLHLREPAVCERRHSVLILIADSSTLTMMHMSTVVGFKISSHFYTVGSSADSSSQEARVDL
ncbi:hypothetical protein AKJ16_DCAP17131 [Drosera capensis]